MSDYHLEHLDRKAYQASIAKISDEKSLGFANMSMRWWDRHFSWNDHGCVVLSDHTGEHLCYIFYKIDRYRAYITIHNLFTPLLHRRKGYAYELMKMVFDIAVSRHVSRFRLVCISKALDFYLTLGLIYWGLNGEGDYYCDLPMPSDGLDGLRAMVKTSTISTLLGDRLDPIYARVRDNDTTLSDEQLLLYERDKLKLKNHYRFDELLAYERMHDTQTDA